MVMLKLHTPNHGNSYPARCPNITECVHVSCVSMMLMELIQDANKETIKT